MIHGDSTFSKRRFHPKCRLKKPSPGKVKPKTFEGTPKIQFCRGQVIQIHGDVENLNLRLMSPCNIRTSGQTVRKHI